MSRIARLLLTTSCIFLAFSFALNLFFLGSSVNQAHAGKLQLSFQRDLDLVQRVFRGIQEHYVEPEIAKDKTALIHGGVEGMIRALKDPYSRFMPPEGFDDMKTESAGEFGGLGIVIGVRDERVTVIAPIADTPADKQGVLAGDIIVRVDGEPIDNLDLQAVVDLLRGKVGTPVEVTFFRPATRKLITVKIVRAKIPLPSVRSAMLPGGIGYCYAPGFTQKTAPDLQAQLEGFEAKGMKGFILDLRSNPGGLLEAAVAMSKLFLDKGKIVSVKDRAGTENSFMSYRSPLKPWPMVVLINEGSASASEIVAAAIRENERGVLLGGRTFGKGSVQTVIPLQDGSAMALTTAYYYTPSGKLIHKKGIPPDIAVDARPLSTEELIELRELRGQLFAEPSLERKEVLPVEKIVERLAELDSQLGEALGILGGGFRLSTLGTAQLEQAENRVPPGAPDGR